AALGLSQCRRLAAFKTARQQIVERYRACCADLPWLHMAPPPPDQAPFWHLCQVHCDWQVLGMDRAAVFRSAQAAGIALQVHYIPLHHQPLLADATRMDDLAGAEAFYAGVLALPCHPGLGADQDLVLSWLQSLA
ncbi:MAG: DegT/DnrJ/EryC1/StrS family aminotransferase, partial [Planctomycetota bacterium]